MSNINFLIADVIQFVSDTITTSSQGDGTKSNLSSSQSLAPGLFKNAASTGTGTS